MSNEVCGDNRFEIIEKAKQDLLKSTNIQTSEDEMQVIDNILFRCWQMGWLEKYEQPKADWIPCEVEMPKDETLMYWTTHEDGSIIMHGYLKRNGFIYNWEVDDLEKRKRQGKVVAWMPIFKPQPYKKEGAE